MILLKRRKEERLKTLVQQEVSTATEKLKIEYEHLESTYQTLYHSNHELLESIRYAQFIQESLFPKQRHFNRAFENYFVYHSSKDILTGDFYWVTNIGTKSILAVGDCTGHGIAGALLTTLGFSFLNYIVHYKNVNSSGDVLDMLDEKFKESFQVFTEKNIPILDWMEIGVVVFDNKDNTLEFSGAKRSLLVTSENGVVEYQGNQYPIGGLYLEENRKFDTDIIQMQKGESFYMFTDGVTDQFGGEKGKKFSKRQLLETVSKYYNMNISEQEKSFTETFNRWKSNTPNIDDITLVGVKI